MCYRPVGVSYAASTPVVWGGILIIGNNVHKTNNALPNESALWYGYKLDFRISMKWSICSLLRGSKRRCSKSRCLVFRSV